MTRPDRVVLPLVISAAITTLAHAAAAQPPPATPPADQAPPAATPPPPAGPPPATSPAAVAPAQGQPAAPPGAAPPPGEAPPATAAALPGAVPSGPPPPRLGARPGQLAFSAERLFGLSSWTATIEPDGGREYEVTGTGVNLLWGSANTGADEFDTNPYAVPRLAVDVFPIYGLSVGLSLGYSSSSGEAEAPGTGRQTDLASISAFAIAPRVGFAHMFGDYFGVWPRAGFTYIKVTVHPSGPAESAGERDDETSFHSISLEGMFVISPVPHFAVVLGPLIDIGVGGEREDEEESALYRDDITVTNFGIVAGLVGYL